MGKGKGVATKVCFEIDALSRQLVKLTMQCAAGACLPACLPVLVPAVPAPSGSLGRRSVYVLYCICDIAVCPLHLSDRDDGAVSVEGGGAAKELTHYSDAGKAGGKHALR